MDHTRQAHWQRMLLPSLWQWLGCTTFVFIVLSVAFWRVPVEVMATLSGVNSEELAEVYGQWIKDLSDIALVNYLGFILFWVAVGVAAYIVFWVFRVVYADVRNDYMLTHEFFNAGRADRYHKHLILKFALATSWIVLLALAAFVLLPAALPVIAVGIVPGATLTEFLYGLLGIGGLIATTYALLTWLKVTLAL